MLSPTEIYDNVEALVAKPPAGGAFGLALMEACGAPKVAVTRVREDAQEGRFVWTRMLWFEAVEPGETGSTLDRMRAEAEKMPKGKRPRILFAYDGDFVAVRDTKVGDEIRVDLDALAYEADILFPFGGHERYVPAPERLADVRATKYLSRLFDAIRDANPTWGTEAHRHALNVLMARLLFCLFSDDVGIFDKDAFETALVRSTVPDGSDLRDFLVGAFEHMNTPPDERSGAARGWSRLPYVNGKLFKEAVATPDLDGRCRRSLLDCARLDWRAINPDIFGSMLQAVIDPGLRGELGMHYTSPSNIMKVLGPIILDDLKAELERAGTNKGRLDDLLARLGRIRVFDPACGSGNFLILAYKELRAIEMEVFRRLGKLPHDLIKLDNFYGIEIHDFACQTARLGLWIAQYQMDEQFRTQLGRNRPFLPLSAAGNILQGNAASVDWMVACPPAAGTETILVGNPQFKGTTWQTASQKEDMEAVFKGVLPSWGELDYVALWFLKGIEYVEKTGSSCAFVSTNSIVQGVQVQALWPRLLRSLEISFAHRSFKWSNLAKHNAGVTCVIVGLRSRSPSPKLLYDGVAMREVDVIGPYLAPGTSVIVGKASRPLFGVAPMEFGNKPTDAGHLLLDRNERDNLLKNEPEASRYIHRLYGSQELMKGVERWCIWVRPNEVAQATAIPALTERFEQVKTFRTASKKVPTQKFAARPWSFDGQKDGASHVIMVPAVTSEKRQWLPVEVMASGNIVNNKIYAIFDGEIWQAAVLSARLHRLWLETVGGRLKEDPSYSNQLVWNTFPLPSLSDHRKSELEEHWWEIDRARKEAGFGRTLGELYAPKAMPADLRLAHEALDETMERLFGARSYRSDADRIEHLLQLYDRAILQNDTAGMTKRVTKAQKA